MPKPHSSIILLGIVDSAHHALVIAEEEDGQPGDTVDPRRGQLRLRLSGTRGLRDEEAAFLQPVADIVTRYSVHLEEIATTSLVAVWEWCGVFLWALNKAPKCSLGNTRSV